MRGKFRNISWLFLLLVSFIARGQSINRVGPVRITVADMNRSLAFYTQVLSFQLIDDQEFAGENDEKLTGVFGIRLRVATIRLGLEEIQLVDYLTAGGRSIQEDAKSNDLSFQHIAIVVADMDSAYARLRRFNVEHVSTGPQTLPKTIPEAEGIRAFYFRDPDRHNLELIFFPKGKGNPRWQHIDHKLFLGIDHTAIGISNTEKSLSFYNRLLGFEKKGESWNRGTEQAHLNNVEGASLHITGLGAGEGIGLEFLQYLAPGPGKLYPADTRADDLWCWQTIIWSKDADFLYRLLKDSGVPILSKGLVDFGNTRVPYRKAFMVRDPDGHALLIAEK